MLLVYALPLFFPPPPVPLGTVTPPDAWLLARIFPGVPASWVAVRLLALTGAALLLSGAARGMLPTTLGGSPWRGRSRSAAPDAAPPATAPPIARASALAFALLHLGAAPLAATLGPVDQIGYLAALAVPPLLLTTPESWALLRSRHWRRGAGLSLTVIAAWAGWCLLHDLDSPRVADVVDGWRAWVDLMAFVDQGRNLLVHLLDDGLPGIGGLVCAFHGMTFYQTSALSLSLAHVQMFQIASLAGCAAGIGLLARLMIGAGAAPIAIAVFLFSPYTRFVALAPGPFVAGPAYATAIALAAWAAWRWRSEAALAALGAAVGIGVQYPGVLPTVVCFLALTVWQLRDSWRERWVGIAAGAASCLAVVVPALAEVLKPQDLFSYHRWDGLVSIIDAGLLGQLPVGIAPPAFAGVTARPWDILVAASLAPFANPRIGVRLMGDAVFDPLGGALLAIGIVACLCVVHRSWLAFVLLAFLGAALGPAYVSPVDVVDIVHAVVLPVPVALVAALGFVTARGALFGAGAVAARATALVTMAVAVGGTILFDVVTPRVLAASAPGIMFQVLRPEDADRALWVSYGPRFFRPTKTLYIGPITAFGGPRPVGYLGWDEAELPAADFAHEGKDLLFWSFGFDWEFTMRETICRQWPAATFYEIHDRARLGRTYAARLGGAPWQPSGADGRWRAWDCDTHGPPVEGHGA